MDADRFITWRSKPPDTISISISSFQSSAFSPAKSSRWIFF
jgi:hypothetical protein